MAENKETVHYDHKFFKSIRATYLKKKKKKGKKGKFKCKREEN